MVDQPGGPVKKAPVRKLAGVFPFWGRCSDENLRAGLPSGGTMAYPRSRGRVLRYIGEDLEKAVELLVERELGLLF